MSVKKRKKQSQHVFYVGSLLHKNPAEYVAICCSMTGHVIGHRNGTDLFTKEPDPEPVKPVDVNPNQLSLL